MPRIPNNFEGKALLRFGSCSKPGCYNKNDIKNMLDISFNDLEEFQISQNSGDLTLYNEDGSEYAIFTYISKDDVYQSLTYEKMDMLVIIEDVIGMVECENCKHKKEINIDIIFCDHCDLYLCNECNYDKHD